MSKHTAGPWKYEKGDEESGYGGRHFVSWEGTECDETTICETHYGEADARLIAASPDMKRLLVDYSWGIDSNGNMVLRIPIAEYNSVIQSATGESIDGQSEEVRG